MKVISSRSATTICAIEYGDFNHTWQMYPMNKVEAALRNHGYIAQDEYYVDFNPDTESLNFHQGFSPSQPWYLIKLRLRIADWFYQFCLKMNYYFKPK